MAVRKQKVLINLLPLEEFESSTIGRILKWAMTSFRWIVIVTEMIVMVCFLSRFWLDANGTDLTDAIKEKERVIAASSNFEADLRLAQKRLAVFSSFGKTENTALSNVNTVVSSLPDEVTLDSYTYSKNLITLKAKSTNEQGIVQFLVNLEKGSNFEQITLNSVDSDPKLETFYTFTVSLKSKNKGL